MMTVAQSDYLSIVIVSVEFSTLPTLFITDKPGHVLADYSCTCTAILKADIIVKFSIIWEMLVYGFL